MTVAGTPEERAVIRSQSVKAHRRARASRHTHRWSAWTKTGLLSTVRRRVCLTCNRVQTRDTG